MFGAISGWNATLHSRVSRNAEQLNNIPNLLCSVAFQPEMAPNVHLVYEKGDTEKTVGD